MRTIKNKNKKHRRKNKKQKELKSSSQPFLSRINSKYDLVIQGPLIPNLNASSPTVYAKEEYKDSINFVVKHHHSLDKTLLCNKQNTMQIA
jgi:hypothetical protein